MRNFILLACLLSVSSALPSFWEDWFAYKVVNKKSYETPSEEHFRLGVYLDNKKMIEEHNAKYEKGLVSYKMKLNHFSDMMDEELVYLNGLNVSALRANRNPKLYLGFDDDVPSSIDWRLKGAVTHVKNQGHYCGSCWAFSTTGSLEGQIFKSTGKLVSLSEQNLIDCADGRYSNEGCNGGLMDNAFEYIKENGGIDTEEAYPYEGTDGNLCRYDAASSAGSISSYVDIPTANEEELKKAVATVGPVSVAMNAGLDSFRHYSEGVYEDAECTGKLNHGVLIVGYGNENGKDYWLVKNSWGREWGDEGYVKIARNEGNMCGIATFASYPVLS